VQRDANVTGLTLPSVSSKPDNIAYTAVIMCGSQLRYEPKELIGARDTM